MKQLLQDYGLRETPEEDLPETEMTEAAPPRPMPELVDAVSFLGTAIESPPELIEGMLHKGSKLALGGNSKAFKTWTLLSLALSVAAGAEWLGCKTVKGKVLFVNFEIQPYAWQRRIAAVARALKVELNKGQILLWNLRGHAADFRLLIPKILERCRAEKFALIVLDPIYKLYGGTDENSARDVAALLNAIEELATETGAAVAYGCHFAKGNAAGKEAIDRISGSGVFARDPDSLLIFTAHEEPEAFTIEPILRNFAPIAPFVVRWKFPLMERDGGLDPSKLKQVVGRKKGFSVVKLLEFISDNDELNPVSIPTWAALANIHPSTLKGYLTEMRDKGWIKAVGEGTRAKQAITTKGKEIINETD